MTKFFIVSSLAFLSCINTAIAGAPDWIWGKMGGGPANEEAKDLCTDAAGNIYVTGFFNSQEITFGKDTLRSAGSADVFVVKLDPSGNVLWARSAGGESNDIGNSICVDALGGVYITGYFQSQNLTFGKTELENVGSMDVLVLKYDATGNPDWAKRRGGADNDAGQSIFVDAENNIYVTGYFQSPNMAFSKGAVTNSGAAGTSDIFLVKYDSKGGLIWVKSAGGLSHDFATSVGCDAQGNIFITGYFKSPAITFGEKTLTKASIDANFADVFIAKYDATGNVIWAKNAGGSSDDAATSACCDADGNIYITGYFQSPKIIFDTVTLVNTGSFDLFVVKYNTSGNVVWAKSPTGVSYDCANDLTCDTKGNVYVTGYFQSPTIIFGNYTLKNENDDSTSDLFVTKFDSNGMIVGARSAGGAKDDESNSIAIDKDGSVSVAGYFHSPTLSFGSSTLSNLGSCDILVAK